MNKKLDKSLILNRIKLHYNFKSDVQLAKFLGIATTTLSNWYARNTMNFDLIFTKCEDLNLNWLVNGEGKPARWYQNLENNPASLTEEVLEKIKLVNNQNIEIERLHQVISLQEGTISAQTKTIEVMNKLIDAKTN